MNQSILFPELEQWQAPSSTITFPAMVNGFQVTCAIRQADLQVLAARVGAEEGHQAPLTLFQACAGSWRSMPSEKLSMTRMTIRAGCGFPPVRDSRSSS